MAIGSGGWSSDILDLAVGSAYFDHACPEDFAPEVPVVESNEEGMVKVADGRSVKFQGRRTLS